LFGAAKVRIHTGLATIQPIQEKTADYAEKSAKSLRKKLRKKPQKAQKTTEISLRLCFPLRLCAISLRFLAPPLPLRLYHPWRYHPPRENFSFSVCSVPIYEICSFIIFLSVFCG